MNQITTVRNNKKLTDTATRNAKPYVPKENDPTKGYKIGDSGLYIFVTESAKYFRMDYHFAGKRNTLSLGVYPKVSLKEAREKCIEAKKLINNDINPSGVKKAKKHNLFSEASNNFEAIATEWHNTNKPKWTDDHAHKK